MAAGAHGNATPLATITGPDTALNEPPGLTLDGGGHLIVANQFANSLTEYPTTGNGDQGPIRTITGLTLPDGVDVDAQGNIYAANSLGGVTEYPAIASGASAPIATFQGPATGISGPSGVAVAPPLIVRTRTLPAARIGGIYRARLSANLGTTPYQWNVIAGRLPSGLHLRRNGTLSGRPSRPGGYRFTVRVKDASRPRMTATRRLALLVRRR